MGVFRNFATKSTFKTCHLVNRSVVRIQGKESADFLQGLMTNDINHLTENHENPAIFAMFLNTQGRVMFDTFITKPNIENDEEFYIDCDKELSEKLVKHLKMYKVRRKLTIEIQENDHVMAVFNPEENLDQIDKGSSEKCKISFNDTRTKGLGIREISSDCSADTDLSEYKLHRYRLGICEGSQEIPFAKVTPLEHNVEFMHGVSFHKGCYLGQELTARTHHTGVIRKRIMPLEFSQEFSSEKNIGS